jgi:hypothetical protein
MPELIEKLRGSGKRILNGRVKILLNIEHRTLNVEPRLGVDEIGEFMLRDRSAPPVYFSFPCSSVGMHAIWVPTLEHGNQANRSASL